MSPRFVVMWTLLLALVVRQFVPTSPASSSTTFSTIPITIQITPAPFVPPVPPSASPVDTAPVVSAAVRASCPPPRTDAAPLPATHELPRGVNHVTTSLTNAGWIAAWSEQHVMLSLDGGLTFTQVLDGPGTVRDVTFDCFGRAIALRAGKVGIREGTREMWRAVPGMRTDDDGPAALVGGGPDVIALAVDDQDLWQARVAVSPDLGATWWFKDLIHYWETSTATGRQDADGTIHLALTTADCMSDPVYWLRIKDGVVETDDLGSIGSIALFDDYALVAGHEGVLWKKFGEASWRSVKAPDGVDDAWAELLAGPLPRVLIHDGVYTFKAGRLSPLRPWTLDETSGAVDRAGRLWGIDETKDGEDAWVVAVPGTRAKIPQPAPESSD